jgi:4-amino-4-deoxy-L-arabinose transferase-like glycosyltransferase
MLAFGWLLRGRRYLTPTRTGDLQVDARRDPRLAGLIVLGGWFASETVTLSFSKGIIHPYYASALGPGAAAMIGAGAVALGKRRDKRLALFALAVAATVGIQVILMDREDFMRWFEPLLAGGAALTVLAVLASPRLMRAGMALTLGILLVAPTAFAASTWDAQVYGTFPAAGPRQAAGRGPYGVSAATVAVDRLLIGYLSNHKPGSRWGVLTVASDTAAPFILLGFDAGSLAGYTGTDPVLDGRGLSGLVAKGQARYVLLGGPYSSRGGNAAIAAAQRACVAMSPSVWFKRAHVPDGVVLFDCAGRARQLAGI